METYKYDLTGLCFDCEMETTKLTNDKNEQLYCRDCNKPIETIEILKADY